MDPNETLNKIRYLSHMYWKGRMEADEALLAFQDLDEWLCKGGFGPCEWEEVFHHRWHG